ncbi:MAG: helix-turn-helix domain-containing protein [Planctomycetota bacterium]
MSDLAKRLAQSGLGDVQAGAFVALLQLGSGSPAEVARQARIPRTSAYAALAALSRQGLVTASFRGRRRRYAAAQPQALLELPRRHEAQLRDLMPDLLAVAVGQGSRPRIAIHEGREGIFRVNEELLLARSRHYRYFGGGADIVEALGETYLRDYVRRRVARGVRVSAIRVRSREVALPCLGAGSRWLREVRYVNRSVVGDLAQLYVWDNRVAVISTMHEGWGMIIDSAELAALVGLVWGVLWDVAETT